MAIKKVKLANIVGARPQFIKYFPIQKAIEEHNLSSQIFIEDILIHTGQHYDYMMSQAFFSDLEIKKPEYHLEVGSASQGLQTALIIQRVEEVLIKEMPDLVIVYGDTNSTLGGALAAAKLHIPIAHIEAGLRSYNKKMPEEINRIVSDRIASILFCPSKTAVSNLIKEGFNRIINKGELISEAVERLSDRLKIDENNPLVINVGDVMYDAFLLANQFSSGKSKIIEKLNLKDKSYAVLTIHRAENTDYPDKLKEIINFASEAMTNKKIIFPIHPRTKKSIETLSIEIPSNIEIIDPLNYYDMMELIKNSTFVLTDSGGLQKEAYWLKIPCITLREETEWIETIQSGWNILYKNWKDSHNPLQQNSLYYGDGKAAEKILKVIILLLNN